MASAPPERTRRREEAPEEGAAKVSFYQFLLTGAASCALASALFWVFARRAGDRHLARMTAVAFVLLCGAALVLWELS